MSCGCRHAAVMREINTAPALANQVLRCDPPLACRIQSFEAVQLRVGDELHARSNVSYGRVSQHVVFAARPESYPPRPPNRPNCP